MASSLPKVLFVADKLGYPGGVSHGVTTYFVNVLPALIEAGVDFTVCFLREPHPAVKALHLHGVEPVFFSAWRADPTVALRVAALAKRRGCTVMHAAGIKGVLMARMAAPLADSKTIVHVHDQNRTGTVIGGLHRVFARPSDLGICVSEAVRSTMVDSYHVPYDRIRVIPNGIKLGTFRDASGEWAPEMRSGLRIAPTTKVIGMFGRFYPPKGHKTMIGMMPRIAELCPEAVLLLAGDGPERRACEELVAKLGLGRRVVFLGQRDDVPQLMSACDITVMPSVSEGLGLAAIESLAAGKPVVAFAVGGIPEVVDDGVTGALVPAGEMSGFAAAVARLLNDRRLRESMAQRASSAAERFSVEEHARQLVQCYREVV